MLRERLKAYPDSEGRFDELFEAPQKPRAHWSRFFRALMGTSAADIHARLEAAERQIRDSGVTYNVYADPQGLDRPWDLDVLPLIIAADEWREIEAGIRQRAHLFDRVLADLYGAQALLQQGLIPPKLLFGQSGFLRSAHSMNLPGGVHLHVYAADLARSPDGRWWVMADRTQAPSGAGYALENRLIVSRAFSALYRDLGVERVARFFATMRDSLSHFAPKGDGPPLTVLLTPGPYNETYFEHSLLARYLGFPLVEGGDLTVRKGRVWLKTIGGLTRVHAILRRQDDTYCDPLELRSDSALGVAGLTDCARRGSVLIANALGSGVIESGALLGFLPGVCEHLTGEPLRLPSIATWWCGEPAALADALHHAKHLVFKTADPAHRFDPVFGEDLDEAGLAALAGRLNVRAGALHRAGIRARVPGTGARPRTALRHLGARRRPARVCHSIPGRIRGDARRAHAGRQRRGRARRVGATRWRLQGHLGDLVRFGRHELHPAAQHGDRRRPGPLGIGNPFARGGEPVLVRALRGTLRGFRAALARGAQRSPARERRRRGLARARDRAGARVQPDRGGRDTGSRRCSRPRRRRRVRTDSPATCAISSRSRSSCASAFPRTTGARSTCSSRIRWSAGRPPCRKRSIGSIAPLPG